MKKICTRILAFIMIVVLAFGSGNISALAKTVSENQILEEEPENNTESDTKGEETDDSEADSDIENELIIEGSDSFGNLLAEAVETEIAAQEENLGYHVFSIEMNGKKATVSFEAMEDAALVVGVYDESGKKLLASGYSKVTKEDTQAIVDIDTDTMPQYFYLRGFLVNADTLRPLCIVYESPNYTREMQEFFSKTTADFDADRVLNLDNDNTNNFAVYEEDTIVLEQGQGNTNITDIDEENSIYVFEYADEEIKSLQVGDIFVYEYDDGTVLIIKVGNIKINGDKVTLKGTQTSLDEVFEFVKIDESAGMEAADVDTDFHEEGITYLGKRAETFQEEGVLTPEAEMEVGKEITSTCELAERKINKDGNNGKASATISGSIELSVKASLKVQITRNYQYLEIKLDYNVGIKGKVSGEAEGSIPLPKFGFRLMPGVYIEFSPAIVLRVDGKIEVNGKLSGSVGYKVSNKKGAENISKAPAFSMKLKADATIFVGISMEPKIKILSDKVAKASLKATVGLEIKGELVKPDTSDSKVKHDCKNCIDGDISKKLEISFEVQFFNKEGLKWSGKVDKIKKTDDFYYSLDFDEYGFGTCPYEKHRVEFVVVGTDGKAIKDADVQIGGGFQKTNGNGSVNAYLRCGIDYTVKVEKSGYNIERMNIRIKGSSKYKVVIGKDKGKAESVNIICGCAVGTMIDSVNNLYVWGSYDGDGGYGNQLGIGPNYNQGDIFEPQLILKNVEQVSLGQGDDLANYSGHGAAVTTDNKLYMWGSNWYGELLSSHNEIYGYSVPTYVRNDVKFVECAPGVTAFITTSGNLYICGYDIDGLKYIMNKVKYISTDGLTYAVIKEDGSLYMWGYNYNGELGGASTEEIVDMPIPVMENKKFKQVSVYWGAIGAVTTNGELFVWGNGTDGHLGTGLIEEKQSPRKILSGRQIVCVDMGAFNGAAVTENGDLYTWGYNSEGQLGNGSSGDFYVASPTKIMSNIAKVSVGYSNMGAVDKNGMVYVWGDNSEGQLGNGTTINSSTPILLSVPLQTENSEGYMAEDKIALQPESGFRMEIENAIMNNFSGTGTFTNLLPNETYNFYAMKSQNVNEVLAADNLLYIGQGKSDASGNLKITYESKEAYDGAISFAVGMTAPDISSATINVSNLTYNGKEQYIAPVVTYKGTTLTEGKDYTLTGDFRAKNVGNYQFSILGIGMFAGEKSAKYSITGESAKKAASITLNYTSIEMIEGTSLALTASIQPQDAADKTVKWISDNPAVATVDSNGMVTAVGQGQAIIKATTNDGSNLSAQCIVYVQPDENEIPEGPKTWEGKAGTEGFVYRLYNVALCREVDEAGFNDWNNKLKSRRKTAAEVAKGFIFSQEFKNFNYNNVQYVKMLYRTMFGREADEGGLNGWVSDLENGMSREYVFRGFAESMEFSNLCQGYGVERGTVTLSAYRDKNVGATGFIARLYTKMLGRAYDDDGLEYWCRKYLTGEKSIEEVATVGFLHSQELTNQNLSDTEFVTRMYRTFLNREPDEAGLADWVNRLKTGRETRDSLVYGFTLSKEFGNIKASYGL